jgi:small subunit ribosomal protein S11
MAKATAKKRKVIVESTGEAHISATFNNIIISLTNKKVKLFLGLQLVKWVLEVLKEILHAAQMAAEDCKVA